MKRLKEEMLLRGFSPKTLKSYTYHINDFLEYCGEYTPDKKRKYILYLINKGYDENTVRLACAAIDFYVRIILKQEPVKVPLPKKKKSIPKVLTKEQIKAMINSLSNIKHRLVIEVLYSSGIRLSELRNLRLLDIDFQNNTLRVNKGKGQKDRITILAKRTAKKIKGFCKGKYVFEGKKGKYSLATIQQIVSKTAKKAGIKQKVTPHMLRHSFATHLLESGVDIRYIQSLLGHERLTTTQVYTRVAKNKLANIKSPLDN